MSDRIHAILLEQIIESINKIEGYTASFTEESFTLDGKTHDAVLMQLIVIGEAASRIPRPIRKKLPDVEWNRIVRSRNIIVHEYGDVDYEIIWRIITSYLPDLKSSLKKILLEL